jgi:hypothetical protein
MDETDFRLTPYNGFKQFAFPFVPFSGTNGHQQSTNRFNKKPERLKRKTTIPSTGKRRCGGPRGIHRIERAPLEITPWGM